MPSPTLRVRILSPQQLVLDTQAISLSSKNSQGSFDILPQHANFITLVENSSISVKPLEGKDLIFKFPLAIIFNSNNQVNIYTYIQPNTDKKTA